MKITICGDFVPIARGNNAVKNKTALSEGIINILKHSDLSIVNLEAPVAKPNETCIPKIGPHLHIEAETLEYLKECGVGMVTLANNHFFDHGVDGVEHTILACENHNILYVGGGHNKAELSKIVYVEKEKIKIAILNYCESEFSVQQEIGSNPINPINVYYDIREAKEIADRIIVITHGGHENYNLPSPRMKQLYRYFIDLGADVVCNHHQHCYSGYEEYNRGFIFYGLGNLFFDDFRAMRNRCEIWNSGYMVSLDIDKVNVHYNIIPYEQCKAEATVILLNDIQKKSFENNVAAINCIIGDNYKLQESFDQWCNKQKKVMLTWFTPYTNRVLMALCRRGFIPKFISQAKRIQLYNAIRCEALRDVILNILNKS